MKLWKSVLITVSLALFGQACTSTEVITANSKPAIQATEQIPYDLLVDVGIIPLDPNLPEEGAAERKIPIVPDVRNAESRFIAFHLKDTMELTGNWGAVRVIPEPSEAVDITVSGEILESDGELLRIRMQAIDSSGTKWLDKEYKDTASKYSYERPKEDPFQDIYNSVADDLLLARQKLSDAAIRDLRQISALRYASTLSPEAFATYIEEQRGKYRVRQLPAANDPMLARIDRIKEQEYLFVDTLDDFYSRFYRDMKGSYDEWRFASYEEAVRLRQMQKQANQRLLTGAALIAGGLYAGSESGTWAGDAAAAGAVVGGIGSIKSGLDRRKQAEIHAESLKELSYSLGNEITPYVLDIEGRTVELTGTADAQYQQWRTLLKDIYEEETGAPSN